MPRPDPQEPKQETRPKKGNPIEIPVPKRESFEKLIRRATKRRPDSEVRNPRNG